MALGAVTATRLRVSPTGLGRPPTPSDALPRPQRTGVPVAMSGALPERPAFRRVAPSVLVAAPYFRRATGASAGTFTPHLSLWGEGTKMFRRGTDDNGEGRPAMNDDRGNG